MASRTRTTASWPLRSARATAKSHRCPTASAPQPPPRPRAITVRDVPRCAQTSTTQCVAPTASPTRTTAT
ncbi:hypothetical protein BBJ28_00001417 [Nothophytophthora sp. Chile5]|nr:hypothetical protein BBJ28_00001417 [Nothophytophthora sp. Chile5]